MAAMVQTYPQQTGTTTMLQSRSSSSVGMMPSGPAQPGHQYMSAHSQAPRSVYHGSGGSTGYRGSSAPVQPYAANPSQAWNQNLSWQQPYGGYRTNSSPAVPGAQAYDQNFYYDYSPSTPSYNMAYTHQMGMGKTGSRDDTAIPATRNATAHARPHSVYLTGQSPSIQAPTAGSKALPDRYRRPNALANHNRSQSMTLPPSSGQVGGSHARGSPSPAKQVYGHIPSSSVDDIRLREKSSDDDKRIRRRSVHAVESTDPSFVVAFDKGKESLSLADTLSFGQFPDKNTAKLAVPSTAATHSRTGSSESLASSRSSHSRPSSATNRSGPVSTGNPSLLSNDEVNAGKKDTGSSLKIPARGSSSDATKRTLSPSPLSKPATMASGPGDGLSARPSTAAGASSGSHVNLNTPAAQHLAAINQKGGKAKSKTSRLRRAFSFGSAAELRKADGTEDDTPAKAEPTRLHKEPSSDETYDAEQARIAEAQEAAGIGNNIYGSRFFGSTDNLSISSTASSASVMLRKMGRGMKKSTRSLAGLFRPKSVVGVPAAEPLAPEASQAAVSMITVEAETQRVNVTAEPQAMNGGTGFPHLERNSMDAGHVPEMVNDRAGSSGTDNSASRKSIVGGDRERAEVLAAVRKGILKRSSSPGQRGADASPVMGLPSVPAITDSPNSSAPSTPNDEAHGHKRSGSIAIGSEDYFMSALRLRQDSRSAPGTPQGSTKRNATFSPRLIFHDTWPSQEYDRRGEIATCNRLTPMLAQQIKEELNTFKMEMEVHENSKIYTHFF